MAYQKKYYFSFKDIRLTERTHLVELWQNTEDVLTAEEIKGHMNPFSVEMPEIDHKFQVVRGCGCQINLLSETDMKFFTGLYHVNPTDFMVKHYIDSVINFYGYLNAEMMSEPYDIDFNYQVSLTGNDGFSLMDRFSFIQLDESNYTGVKSKFELLQIIFAKIGLPFTEYRIALATTFVGQSEDLDKSILHESYVDCANFYDEDDKPMTLRAVVESILAPYGAHIRAELGNIYITDIHSLASLTDVVYKRFTMSTGAYVADVTIPNVKAVSDIGYLGTGHSIERSGGVNRQVVSYSPYPVKAIIEDSLIGTDEFETVPATWSTKNGNVGVGLPPYYYKTLETNETWEIDPIYDFVLDPPTFEASFGQSDVEDNAQIYLRHKTYPLIQPIANYKKNTYLSIPSVSISSTVSTQFGDKNYFKGVAISINAELLIKTVLNPYETGFELSYLVIKAYIYMYIGIGDYWYNSTTKRWSKTKALTQIEVSDAQNSVIADRFVKIGKAGKGIVIPIGNSDEDFILFGDLHIEIQSKHITYTKISSHENFTGVMEMWYKNIDITLSNLDGTDIVDNDVEYIGLLDKTFQNEGEKITLTCGTDTQFADRGKILKSDGTNYSDIKEWTRNAQSFKIEELLLGSVSSNYRAGFVTLSNMKLKNSFSLQNILTDTFIWSAKMMVKSAMINYQDNVVECSLIEILPDELIIVKDTSIT